MRHLGLAVGNVWRVQHCSPTLTHWRSVSPSSRHVRLAWKVKGSGSHEEDQVPGLQHWAVGLDVLENWGKYSCAVYSSGGGNNSIECSRFKVWVYKKCSSITGWLVALPVTQVDVDGTMLMSRPLSATWVTCCAPVGVGQCHCCQTVRGLGKVNETFACPFHQASFTWGM